MVLVLECDRRVNWIPGVHRSATMVRIWWLFFAVAWVRVPFETFVQTAYRWERLAKW